MWSRLEKQLYDALDSLVVIGIALVEAVIVILAARLVYNFVHDRLLNRFDSPELSESGRTALGVLTTVVVGLVATTVLLAVWGVTWSGIITAVSLGTLGILLGIGDVLKSVIGGIFLVLERPYSIGHRITVRDVTGRVIGIELRTTVLRSDEGHRIVLPNSIVFTDSVTNYSLERQIRTDVILTGIGGDVARQRTSIEEAVAGVDGVDGSVEVRFRLRSPRVRRPGFGGGRAGSANGQKTPRNPEVWVSWLGGGEPEVYADVVAQLRTLYPTANVRRRKVRGAFAPQRTAGARTPPS